MSLPTHPTARAVAWLSMALLAASCSSADSRAQAALGAYQAAAASNDMLGARRALLQLVKAKEDVADYWAELGRVETALGSDGDAYYAFSRAYELDRSNVELARTCTQLALKTGDLATAQARAEELDVLAPGDPWVKLTKAWGDVAEFRYDQALSTADNLLVKAPFDPVVSLLKGRALVGLGREDEAIAFLSRHVQATPSNSGALSLLAGIYERRDDWANVVSVRQRLSQVKPDDQNNLVALVEAALRSGRIPQARMTSFRLLRPNASAALVSRVLDGWLNYWPSSQRIEDARKLAAAAPMGQRLVYAAFLSRFGSPVDALYIAAPLSALPVKAENAEADAVLADALARSGKLARASTLLDAVIAFDPGNATALRARTELELRTGRSAQAVEDAQKLVTVLPTSASDRLLLAKAFAAAGNKPAVDRTLWTAFRDIPGDDSIYAALRSAENGNSDELADLQAEFGRQRDAQFRKGLL